MNSDAIPPQLIKPVLIVAVIVVLWWFYLWSTGNLSEDKLVETIAKKRDEPLADLHAPDRDASMHFKKPAISPKKK